MDDKLKSKFFRDLLGSEIFQAQLALEEETYNALLSKLTCLDLSKPELSLEYAKLRGSLEVLKSLRGHRERLAQDARSRD